MEGMRSDSAFERLEDSVDVTAADRAVDAIESGLDIPRPWQEVSRELGLHSA